MDSALDNDNSVETTTMATKTATIASKSPRTSVNDSVLLWGTPKGATLYPSIESAMERPVLLGVIVRHVRRNS